MRPLALLFAVLLLDGCYHYRVQLREPVAGEQVVVHQERAATYVNGFVGTGELDARKYCADPLTAELRVNASDVLLSVVTLLIYTPHTLYVTCPRTDPGAPTP